jgi:methionyl-tRNA formyltransferase
VTEPPAHPRRLVYLGTPDVAVAPLRALHAAGFEIPLVVTRVDKRRGRGSSLVPSPVKATALELGLAVTDQVDDILDIGADLGVVVAFGRIIKPHVLDVLPMVNLHFSLLPRWRGAAPVERAILAGDATTGVCVMAVEEGLDTGGVYRRAETPIDPDETLDELRGRLVVIGTELLLDALANGLGPVAPQTGEVTHAAKIDPSELALDFAAPAVAVHATVRLGDAWTTFRGKRLKVWRTRVVDPAEIAISLAPGHLDGSFVGTGDGVLELVEVQPEGKGRQPIVAWRNGARPTPTDRLGA